MSLSSPEHLPTAHLPWALNFLIWAGGLIAMGALLGLILYPLIGWVAGLESTPGELALNGLRDLGFYALMWAPGIALVVTVKREYEARQATRLRSESPADH